MRSPNRYRPGILVWMLLALCMVGFTKDKHRIKSESSNGSVRRLSTKDKKHKGVAIDKLYCVHVSKSDYQKFVADLERNWFWFIDKNSKLVFRFAGSPADAKLFTLQIYPAKNRRHYGAEATPLSAEIFEPCEGHTLVAAGFALGNNEKTIEEMQELIREQSGDAWDKIVFKPFVSQKYANQVVYSIHFFNGTTEVTKDHDGIKAHGVAGRVNDELYYTNPSPPARPR